MQIRTLVIGGLAAAMNACANTPSPAELDNRIIIPEDAVQVDHIDFFTGRELIHLNQHSVVVRAGTRPYLLVFDEACPKLDRMDSTITLRARDKAVYARTDVLVVNGSPCQIDRIYSITSEDEKSLREQLRP
jgi:Family of unknown function (DUF6491)